MKILGHHVQSAYRALDPAQRDFVDSLVQSAESLAVKNRCTVAEIMGAMDGASLPQRQLDMLNSLLVQSAIRDRVLEIDDRNVLTEYKIMRLDAIRAHATLLPFLSDDRKSIDITRATPDDFLTLKKYKRKEHANGMVEEEIELHDVSAPTARLSETAKMRGPDSTWWSVYKRDGQARPAALPVPDDQLAQEAAWVRDLEALR